MVSTLSNGNSIGRFRQFSGGYSTKFYTGRLGLEVQPVSRLYITFDRKGPPFIYLLLTVGTLLHTKLRKLHPF